MSASGAMSKRLSRDIDTLAHAARMRCTNAHSFLLLLMWDADHLNRFDEFVVSIFGARARHDVGT